jgi:plasmid segregation protein ParM
MSLREEDVSSEPVIRAVDIGYGNSKFSIGRSARKIECRHFPSVAPLATGGSLTEALGSKRRTVEIEIDQIRYEVGQDATLAQGAFSARNMDDDFCTTPEYLALVRGALHYMDTERVDLLVVGLPVSTVESKRSYLERRLTGIHPVGGRRQVEVLKVKVLAQPRGALMTYANATGRRGVIRNQRSLIIDCGARTFDWLVVNGLKVNDKRSGAVNRGMLDVQMTIAEGIDKQFNTRFTDFERIERALHGDLKVAVFGDEYDISAHVPAAQKVAQEAVTAMRRHVQDGVDIDNIIVAGGGAEFFSSAIRAAFPRHQVHRLEDGMYANVRGFHLAGEQFIEDAQQRRIEAGAGV